MLKLHQEIGRLVIEGGDLSSLDIKLNTLMLSKAYGVSIDKRLPEKMMV